jgi:hypothetical protein
MLSNSSNQASPLSTIPPWERRIHQRFEVQAEALLIDHNWHTQRCRCTDLSRGGACVFTSRLPRPGKLIELWFQLSHASSIECEAEVVRRASDRVGVRFITLDDYQMNELEHFLASARLLD